MCSFNWMYQYRGYLVAIYPQMPKIHKSVAKITEFVFWNHEYRGEFRAIIIPICAGCRFRPAMVRLVGGDAELPPRTDIITKLCISVDFSGS